MKLQSVSGVINLKSTSLLITFISTFRHSITSSQNTDISHSFTHSYTHTLCKSTEKILIK